MNETNKHLEKPPGLALRITFIFTLLVAIILAVALTLVVLGRSGSSEQSNNNASNNNANNSNGPCSGGSQNNLPNDYSWYENQTLGYKFAYPSAWGAPSLATTPAGGTAGNYANITFPNKPSVVLGGNATNYVVNPRGGMPTDNPGFLQAGNKYYGVQIWQLHNASTGLNEPKYALFAIEDSSTLANTCNTKALVTQYPMTEFYGYSYDLARINLQPTNLYYGVNVVVKNATDADRADLQKILSSFQLIP